jgi:glycosyltransferase involved in cell wall biosynthesis
MSTKPDVSVVMSVYNGEPYVAATIDSILSQRDVNFEFIIVNDGSTDQTSRILEDYARRDNRVRIIDQENAGLTRALISACRLARGEFIARQDAGDISLAGRLAHQLRVFNAHPSVVMTSCGTRLIGPSNELLCEVTQVEKQLHRGLQQLDPDLVVGPSSHTSVMFRRDAYEKVGEYRAQFYVAQDLDLWMRLSEVGICWATPAVLCERKLHKNSIGAKLRHRQIHLAKVIVECAAVRRSGRDDSALLAKWAERSRRNWYASGWLRRRVHEAKFYYFIGSMLRDREPGKAQLYFWRAIMRWCPYPRAWYGLIRNSRVWRSCWPREATRS